MNRKPRGNIRTAILAGTAGLGMVALAGCVSPARTPSDAYAPPATQQTTTTTSDDATGSTTTTTTTTTTNPDGTVVYRGDGYAPYGHGDTYDDPNHYGRGVNQHKY
jgi:hypothetical protein